MRKLVMAFCLAAVLVALAAGCRCMRGRSCCCTPCPADKPAAERTAPAK